jgi:hypothetical protein
VRARFHSFKADDSKPRILCGKESLPKGDFGNTANSCMTALLHFCIAAPKIAAVVAMRRCSPCSAQCMYVRTTCTRNIFLPQQVEKKRQHIPKLAFGTHLEA